MKAILVALVLVSCGGSSSTDGSWACPGQVECDNGLIVVGEPPGMRSHFQSCPSAKKFRRPK